MYSDLAKRASLMVNMNTSTQVYSLSGSLDTGIIIKPVHSQTVSMRYASCYTCLEVTWHSVEYLESHGNHSHYEEATDDGGDDYEEVMGDYSRARTSRKVVWKVYPEVLVVVDDRLYQKFDYNLSRVQQYIISFFNAVNFIFSLLSSPAVDLSLAGIIVSQSGHGLPFLVPHTVPASAALHSMGQYYYHPRPGLPVHDMVVTLTARDLVGENMDRNTAGYAYVGGACIRNTRLHKINSVAIVEDSGGYSGVVTAAHEIGHLLGVVHDGDPAPSYLQGPGAASCSKTQGFIMSDNRRTSAGMAWSPCSVRQIRHFLRTKTASCLLNYPR